MGYLKDIEEIVGIIAKKSPVKDKIMEITKIYLDAYKSGNFVKNIEDLWSFIVIVPLSGCNHLEYTKLNRKEVSVEIDDFDEDYIWKCPTACVDWKEYAEEYVNQIKNLLEIHKIDLDLEGIEYDDETEIPEVSIQINEKFRKKGYVLIELGVISDSYESCVVEEKDFERIKEILEKDEELAKNARIQEFNKEI